MKITGKGASSPDYTGLGLVGRRMFGNPELYFIIPQGTSLIQYIACTVKVPVEYDIHYLQL